MGKAQHFYNKGFGWVCIQCEREFAPAEASTEKHSRMFREGEAEAKDPRLNNPALAKWFDKMRTTLICPNCGIKENVDNC